MKKHLLLYATYQARYSMIVHFPFFFFSFISVHCGQIRHLKYKSKTWAVFSAIADTIFLFAVHPQLTHHPSNWDSTSTVEESPYSTSSFRMSSFDLSTHVLIQMASFLSVYTLFRKINNTAEFLEAYTTLHKK